MKRTSDAGIRSRLQKFNRWEEAYNRRKSPKQAVEEFGHLYALIFDLEPARREAEHRKHLEHLIVTAKRLKQANNEFKRE